MGSAKAARVRPGSIEVEFYRQVTGHFLPTFSPQSKVEATALTQHAFRRRLAFTQRRTLSISILVDMTPPMGVETVVELPVRGELGNLMKHP